ncbi:Rieske (2Fe-2S) protein [Williamsia deligens]|uniref:Rieske (2Fe-2S) protein n=1 Tax=Williamsia deligens TaxID=321325 RepID=A0ABW3GAQ0_9NOCA|nr:Rieske (2Fe-2S) protein [Williamsia deligens]MCP2195228.1 nitrite reductase (NADH) small subunit [Williamsia deligens]
MTATVEQRWTTVGDTSDLTPGEGRAYVVDGRQIAVFLLTDGSVRASDAVCPHRGGPIADGQVDSRHVVCPLHQYAFRFADGGCTDPAIAALTMYPTRVTGSAIEVAVPDRPVS